MNNKVNRFLLYANPLLLAKLMMKKKDVPPVPPVVEKYFNFKVSFPTGFESGIKAFVKAGESPATEHILNDGETVTVKENETLYWEFVNTPPSGEWYLVATDIDEATLMPTYLNIFRNNGHWIHQIGNVSGTYTDKTGSLTEESFSQTSHTSGSTVNLYLVARVVPQQDFVYVALTNENWVNTDKKVYINGQPYDVPGYQETVDLEGVQLKVGDTIGFTADGSPTSNEIYAVAYLDDTYEISSAATVFDCSMPTTSSSMLNIAEIQTNASGGTFPVANQMKLRTDAFSQEKTPHLNSGQGIYIDFRDNQTLLGEIIEKPEVLVPSGYDIKVTQGETTLAYINTMSTTGDPAVFKMSWNPSSSYKFSFEKNTLEEGVPTKLVAYTNPSDSEARVRANIFKVDEAAELTSEIDSSISANITIGKDQIQSLSGCWNIFFEWEPVGEEPAQLKWINANMNSKNKNVCGFDVDIVQSSGTTLHRIDTDILQTQGQRLKLPIFQGQDYKVKFEFNNISIKNTKLSAYKMVTEGKESIDIFTYNGNKYSTITSNTIGTEYVMTAEDLIAIDGDIYFEWEYEGTQRAGGYCTVICKTHNNSNPDNVLKLGKVSIPISTSASTSKPIYLAYNNIVEFQNKADVEKYCIADVFEKENETTTAVPMFRGNNTGEGTTVSGLVSLTTVSETQNNMVQVTEYAATYLTGPYYMHINYLST